MSILLIFADLLIQQYTRGVIILTPTFVGGGVLFFLCLVSTYFMLKPSHKSDNKMNSSRIGVSSDANGTTPLAEALADLVRQYTEERKLELKVKSQQSAKMQTNVKKINEQELSA